MKITPCSEKIHYEKVEHFITTTDVPLPPVQLHFKFPKSYKNYLNFLNPDHETWMLENHKNEVIASGSLLYKNMNIEGISQKVAITSFMKTKAGIKSTSLWAKHLLPYIRKSLESNDCKYIFSFVFQSLRKDIRTFRKALRLKKSIPRFFLVRKASYILIQGRTPWRSKTLKGISIRIAQLCDVPQILHFLKSQQTPRSICQSWDLESVENRVQTSLKKPHPREQLHVAINKKKVIVGIFQPFIVDQVRQDIPKKVTKEVQSYFQLQHILCYLGICNKPPKINQPIKQIYLSLLDSINPDVFESLLHYAYTHLKQKNEIISYTHFSGNITSKPPSGFIFGSMPLDLYLILPPEEEPPLFLRSYWMAPTPELEGVIF